MVLTVEADYEGEDTFRLVSEIRAVAESHYPGQWHLAGEGVSTYDLMNTVTRDMVKVNLVAILAVFAVLLALLRSAVLPVILVLSIETAIWLNLSLPYFTDSYVFYIAYLIISSIQLGATVDYAILLSDRYREFRQTMDKKQAVVETVSAVTVSILTSGISAGRHLEQRSSGPAGHLPRRWRDLLPCDRSVCSAGSALSVRQAVSSQKETYAGYHAIGGFP